MSYSTKKQTGKKLSQASAQSQYHKVNGFFERHQSAFFAISMVLCVLMSLFMFDIKVSLSGDDCDYIVTADNFWRHFKFPPGGHGSLYPIVLSPFVGIFGINLILLKSLSSLFLILSFWLLYLSFRGKIPAVVLMPSMLLAGMCSFVFFYAGYTYSEPLFMLFQALFIYFFSTYFLGEKEPVYQLKTDWRKYIILASFALCMTLTRTIGYGVIGIVILYFAFKQRWRDLLSMLAAIVLVFGLWKVFQSVVWPDSGEPYSLTMLLAKDYYNQNLGMEDFSGLCTRFVENALTFLSAFLCQFAGLIPETPSNLVEVNIYRLVFIFLLFAVCLVVVFKRKKALLFTGIYTGIMCFFSFVMIQSSWGQDRIIVVYYPLILIFLLGGICYLFRLKALRKLFFIYPLLLLVICFGTLSITKDRVGQNILVLQQNMLGDQLYGLTPDWQNFIRGSQWAAKNLEKDAVIISRKASISKVYTGRDFMSSSAAMTVPNEVLDALVNDSRTIVVINADQKIIPHESFQYIVTAHHLSADEEGRPFVIDGANSFTVCIYALEADPESFIQMLKDNQIGYSLDYDTFLQQAKSVDNFRIYDPEMMYRSLIDARVDYLLLPQLRMNPSQNTGMYINTVHRFLWFISYKYQGRFQIIHTVGKADDEPCEIVKFLK